MSYNHGNCKICLFLLFFNILLTTFPQTTQMSSKLALKTKQKTTTASVSQVIFHMQKLHKNLSADNAWISVSENTVPTLLAFVSPAPSTMLSAQQAFRNR